MRIRWAAILFFVACLGATQLGSPPACVPDTLDHYIALGAGGCSVDSQFAFRNFDFKDASAPLGPTHPLAGSITVTPFLTAGGPSFTFTSAGFFQPEGTLFSYLLTYEVDPHPIIVGFTLDLLFESPVAPGSASISANLCVGDLFPACGGGVVDSSVAVSHYGITPVPTDSTAFGAVAVLGVQQTIVPDGGPSGGGRVGPDRRADKPDPGRTGAPLCRLPPSRHSRARRSDEAPTPGSARETA